MRYHPSQREAAHARFMIAKCYVAQEYRTTGPWCPRATSATSAAPTTPRPRCEISCATTPTPTTSTRLPGGCCAGSETLARHEMYVATFYASRNRYNAAMNPAAGRGAGERLRAPPSSQALLGLGRSYCPHAPARRGPRGLLAPRRDLPAQRPHQRRAALPRCWVKGRRCPSTAAGARSQSLPARHAGRPRIAAAGEPLNASARSTSMDEAFATDTALGREHFAARRFGEEYGRCFTAVSAQRSRTSPRCAA